MLMTSRKDGAIQILVFLVTIEVLCRHLSALLVHLVLELSLLA